MAKLEEFLSSVKTMNLEQLTSAFKQMLSDPKQLAVVVVFSALLLILLMAWVLLRSKRDDEQIEARDSDPGLSSVGRQHGRVQTAFKREMPQSAASHTNTRHTPVNAFAGQQSPPLAQQQVSEIPQDSVLRRHYLGNEEAKDMALHQPYPSDSILRRHYDMAHKLVVDIADTGKQPVNEIPEDSVLRRHYLANEAAKEAALHDPYPTDSVLRRHYDAAHKIQLETSAGAEPIGTQGLDDTSAVVESSRKTSSIEAAIDKAAQNIASETVSGNVMPLRSQIKVPEDSVLKRHFIAQLQAEIEAGLSPRPTDSVLRRHHDSLVGCELEKRLAN